MMDPIDTALHVARGSKVHAGPIRAATGGRTDRYNVHVKSGSYVLPADVISHWGDGNSDAGFKLLSSIFRTPDRTSGSPYAKEGLPYDAPEPKAAGGAAEVPVVVAGGEFILEPHEVARIGGGDLDLGHSILDHFVLKSRAQHIKTLQKLPAPRKN